MIPPQPSSTPASPTNPLLILRIIWTALLMGECAFLAIIVFSILPHQPKPDHPMPILVWVAAAMLLTIVPITFAIRLRIHNRTDPTGHLPPTAYATGNIMFWAGCESVAFFSLMVTLVNGSLMPTLIIALIAMATQAITFTLGKPQS